MAFITVRGVRYHVVVEGSGPPLIMLHGFMGNSRSWDHIADALQQHVRLIRLDLLGHGASQKDVSIERYALKQKALDVLAIADALHVPAFHLLGYSLGGRVAQHVALLAPERLHSLILESASPGIADLKERLARQRADEQRANAIETDGIHAFVSYWEALPLFASERNVSPQQRAALHLQRVNNSPLGLARSLRGAGAGTQQYTLPQLKTWPKPTMLLAGELDTKYVKALQHMARVIPQAKLRIVPEAGHAIHRERPKQYVQVVTAFLRGIHVS